MADTSISPDSSRPSRRRIRSLVSKPAGGGRVQLDKEAFKDLLLIVGLPAFVLIVAFWFAARFIKPAPPDNFVMTTGADGGAYHLFAERYRDILKRERITVTLKPSARSIENFQRLQDANSDVVRNDLPRPQCRSGWHTYRLPSPDPSPRRPPVP